MTSSRSRNRTRAPATEVAPEHLQSGASRNIGSRIRFMRRQRTMTLDDVAKATGLTKSYLSKIEREISVPSIATALKVAASFDVTVGQLIGQEQDEKSICVVRKGERSPFTRVGSKSGYHYEVLAGSKRFKSIEPFIMRPPLEFENSHLFEHVGEEFIFVLSGAIEVQFVNRRVALKAGDAIYFDSYLPHRTRSVGRKPAEALVIITE